MDHLAQSASNADAEASVSSISEDALAVRIAEFIERSNTASSSDEVFDLFRRIVDEYGYSRLALVPASPAAQHLLGLQDPRPSVVANVPETWIQHYFEQHYETLDPVLARANRNQTPIIWDEVLKLDSVSQKQKLVLLESRDAGIHNGVSLPVHGPTGTSFLVSLGNDLPDANDPHSLATVHVLAMQFLLAFWRTIQKPDELGAGPHLTERERECLTWTARGKSAWSISMILGVSEHTVNFHLKSAMKKLGVTNRVLAVVSSIQLGLIHP